MGWPSCLFVVVEEQCCESVLAELLIFQDAKTGCATLFYRYQLIIDYFA
jgi:hypothetical protein